MNTATTDTPSSSFLFRVAQHYWNALHEQVSGICFVFPNRRAGLFFRKHLAAQANHPIFAPETITIEQLFQDLSDLQLDDSIDLLFRLYTVYQQQYLACNTLTETFDDFIFWGQMMLNDFNDIDRHQVDATQLFANLADLKDIELRFNELPNDQKVALQHFAQQFSDHNQSALRHKFHSIWQQLLPVYNTFRRELKENGLAYMGMLQREVIENLHSVPEKQYVFIGFNALTATEEALMLFLQKHAHADFYFDYESEWLQADNNRASRFYKHNTETFPTSAALPLPPASPPRLHLIKIPSYVGQAGQIYQLLQQLCATNPSAEQLTSIGIVLPDEHMLLPLLNAIPESIQHINVTMGLPIADTPVFALLQHLSELQLLYTQQNGQLCFHYKPVLSLLHHPYIYDKSGDTVKHIVQTILKQNMVYIPVSLFSSTPLLQLLFQRFDTTPDTLHYLRTLLPQLADDSTKPHPDKNEYIYQVLLIINRLTTLFTKHEDIPVQVPAFYNLLLSLCSGISVPFEGEPLQGLQIMGVLEARGMDFSTLILTDFNDETFSGNGIQNSYIPYDLRCAFHLPTTEQQDAIAAYNFYRLISHANDVYLLQNTISDDRTSGEESRFLHQLQHQYGIAIDEITVNYTPRTATTQPIVITKDDTVIRQITERLCPSPGQEQGKGLSPSALNTYVQCPLHFYLTYICGFRETDQIEENIQNDKFGTILHSVMEQLYKPYVAIPPARTRITEDIVNSMLQRLNKESLVEDTYTDVFLHSSNDNSAHLQGKDQLPIHVIKQFARSILLHDLQLAKDTQFYYIATELRCRARFTISNNRQVCFNGIIDRIDEVDGITRIVDYKTGAEHSTFPEFDSLFAPDKGKSDHVRQTLIYSLLFEATTHNANLSPYIYYVKKGEQDMEHPICYNPGKGSDTPSIDNYAEMREAFSRALTNVLEELFNPDIKIEARPDSSQNGHCRYCPFASFCGISN